MPIVSAKVIAITTVSIVCKPKGFHTIQPTVLRQITILKTDHNTIFERKNLNIF